MQNYMVLLGVGLTAGVMSGFFGIGGGILIIPALMFLLGFSQHQANGTSLVALLLPVGVLGAMAYYRAGKISEAEIKAGLWIALGLFLGAYFGGRLAVTVSPTVLRKAFCLFLVAAAAKLWFTK